MATLSLSRKCFTGGALAPAAAAATPVGGLNAQIGPTASAGSVASSIDGTVAVFAQRLNESDRSIAINVTESFPAASIIELVILLTLYEAIDAGKLRLDK